MELSVAARVKARISTPYIDADGRGVRSLDGAPLHEIPLCMLPPREFHQRQLQSNAASRSDDTNNRDTVAELEQLEAAESRALLALEAGCVRAKSKLAVDLARDLASAADGLAELADIRAARRRKMRRDWQMKLDSAYARRQDSEAALELFNALSRNTRALAEVNKEESIIARFEHLSGLREVAQRTLDEATQRVEERALREVGAARAVHEAQKKRREADQAAEMRQKFAAELAQRAEQRRRRLELESMECAVQLEADVERAVWREKANRVADAERELTRFATVKEQALHTLVTAHKEIGVEAQYSRLRHLQAEFERHAAEIKLVLDRHTKNRGSYLEALFVAASDTASKKRVVFRGLELLADATLASTLFTPRTRPSMKNAEYRVRDFGSQFPLPESNAGRRNHA